MRKVFGYQPLNAHFRIELSHFMTKVGRTVEIQGAGIRAVVALMLAIVVVVHLPLTSLWYAHQFSRIRKEVKKELLLGVSEDRQLEFVMPLEEASGLPRPKPWEFDWNGKRYDIISEYHDASGYWHVTCIVDHEESELKRSLAGVMHHHTDEFPPLRNGMHMMKLLGKVVPSLFQIHFNEGIDEERTVALFDDALCYSVELEVLQGPPDPLN